MEDFVHIEAFLVLKSLLIEENWLDNSNIDKIFFLPHIDCRPPALAPEELESNVTLALLDNGTYTHGTNVTYQCPFGMAFASTKRRVMTATCRGPYGWDREPNLRCITSGQITLTVL
jgi:hypothetical protein